MTENLEKEQNNKSFFSKIYPSGFKDEAFLIFKNSIPLVKYFIIFFSIFNFIT